MALEDGEWEKADGFFEDVLNQDARSAQAYLGKALAQEKCSSLNAFVQKRIQLLEDVCGETFSLTPDQPHVLEMMQRYSVPGYVTQEEIRQRYNYDLSYRSDAGERREQYKNEEIYWDKNKSLIRAEKLVDCKSNFQFARLTSGFPKVLQD